MSSSFEYDIFSTISYILILYFPQSNQCKNFGKLGPVVSNELFGYI